MPIRPRWSRGQSLREPALGLFAVLEALWRADPGLVPVAVSVLANVGVGVPAATVGLNVALVAGAAYVFAPVVFHEGLGDRRGRRDFRLLVAGVSTTFAAPVVAITHPAVATASAVAVLGYLAAVLVGSTLAVLAYFRRTDDLPLLDPESDAMAVLRSRSVLPVEAARELLARQRRRGPRRTVVGIQLAAAGVSYVTLCALFGIAAALLGWLFPVLEAAVVAGLVIRAVGWPFEPSDRSSERLLAAEREIYDRLTAYVRSQKGMATVAMVLTSVGLVLASLATFLPGALAVTATPGGRLAVGSFLVAVVYAAWYWSRELRRLPAYVASRSTDPAAARPPGLMLPAAVVLLAWAGYLRSWIGAWPTELAIVFAAASAPLLAVLLWTVHRAFAGETQPAGTETYAVPVSFVVTAAGFAAVFAAIGASVLAASIAAIGATFPWLFFLEDANRHARTHGDRGRATAVAYHALPLAWFHAVATALPGTPPAVVTGLYALGSLVLAGGAAGHLLARAVGPPGDGPNGGS